MEKKKEKAVIELFRKTREEKGFSVSEVSESLRISRGYIEAIENKNFDELPEPVYAAGFIKNYARFLGLDEHEAVAEYKRETQVIEEHISLPAHSKVKKKSSSSNSYFEKFIKCLRSFRFNDVSICNIAYIVLILAVVAVATDVMRTAPTSTIDKERILNMKLVTYPNPILSQKCADVEIGDPLVKDALQEMSEKLYEWNGVGLAAPQVGIAKKMVVIDVRDEEGNPSTVYKMVNPQIVWRSDEMMDSDEGCLSLPLLHETIKRHESVTVKYLDENFKPKQISEATGLLSRCIQHELDHLQGKLYIDRLSRLKRSRALEEYKKLQQQVAENATK